MNYSLVSVASASIAEEELDHNADNGRMKRCAVDSQCGVIEGSAASGEEAVGNEDHVATADQMNLNRL